MTFLQKLWWVLLGGLFLPVFLLISCTEERTELKIHPDGWAEPTSANSHIAKIHSKLDTTQSGTTQSWDTVIAGCGVCHGSEFDGGNSGISCYQCHAGGPNGHPEYLSHITSGSEYFHGKVIVNEGLEGLDKCRTCHGKDLDGGVAGKSCALCHAGGESGHPDLADWINPASTDYHGRVFWENGWDFSRCQTCHGADFSGGEVGVSCNTCHVNGVGSCNTCHGDWVTGNSYPPKDIQNNSEMTIVTVGAHTAHMESELAEIACDQCHLVPTDYLDAGHLDSDNRAEITFGSIATDNGNVIPEWDHDNATCSQVYCHWNVQPKWTQVDGTFSACGSCHDLPPDEGAHPSHVIEIGLDCSTCHNGYSGIEHLVMKSKHINSEADVELSSPYGGSYDSNAKSCSGVKCHGVSNTTPDWFSSEELSCTGCHGGLYDQSGAPPNDLNGNQDYTFLGVGSHQAHMNSQIANVSCEDCHVVPESIHSEEHFDTDLVAEIVFSELATDSGAVIPNWDRGAATCSDIYCHGMFSFAKSESGINSWAYSEDFITGNNITVLWTNPGSIECESCHNQPPAGHLNTTSCGSCHSSVVGGDNISIIDKSKHINGQRNYP